MGIQQLLGFIGALWNHKNATDEAFKMKVMPLETAMFFGNLHTNEVSFKRRATGSCCCKDPSTSGQCGSMFLWGGAVSA